MRTVFPGYRAQCHRKFWLTIENYLFHCHVIFRFDAKKWFRNTCLFPVQKKKKLLTMKITKAKKNHERKFRDL